MQKEKFIKFFINRRKELGYSQSKIANEIGISDQAVSNWERGVSFPDLIYLDDIAKLLKTNVDSLITGKNIELNIKPEVKFDAVRFSQYILKLRKNKKMTQKDLGKILEIPGQNISKFENGVFLPSLEVLEKYAEIFNVSFLNLYYGLDDEELFLETQKQYNHNKLKWLITTAVIILVSFVLIIPSLITKKHIVTIILNEDTVLTYRIKDNEHIELPSLPTKKGYDVSWSNTDTLITEDKVFKVIYTPKTYTITYKFENSEIEDYKQTVTYGESFKLYIPDNDNFKGYMYQNKEFTETVYEYDYDITLIGKFDKQYKVTIILDENNSEVRYVEEGTNITLPSLPTKKGYNTSWSDLDTLITEDKVFKVIYTPKTYTITYKFENSEIEDYKQTVTYGESFKLYIPDNDNFKGYMYQNKEFTETVYEYDYDITLIGKFDKQYKVTIILDENNSEVRYVEEGTNITLPSLPTKKGYNTSWSDLDTLITEDKVFKVIYTPKTYTITYKFKNTEIGDYKQTVTYGEKYSLKMPNINEESFMGYTYNGEIITDGIYEYDHDITVYGEFSDESYTIYREYTYTKKHDSVGYGCSFVLDEVDIDLYLSECPYSPGEYENYKIIAWKDQKGNIYEIGNTYIYNYKEDVVLCPVFAYYGDAFKVTINNDEAKIIEYNIDRIIELIIPDYIIIDNNEYKVTEIAEGTFQDTYFKNITISSNITKISKNTFRYDDAEGNASNIGNIYYCGTLYEWFNIDFEEYITSNKSKTDMKLYVSDFLVGESNSSNNILVIPEGIEVITSYSLASCRAHEIIIPNSVHTIEKYAFIYSYVNQIINLEKVENVHQNAFEK